MKLRVTTNPYLAHTRYLYLETTSSPRLFTQESPSNMRRRMKYQFQCGLLGLLLDISFFQSGSAVPSCTSGQYVTHDCGKGCTTEGTCAYCPAGSHQGSSSPTELTSCLACPAGKHSAGNSSISVSCGKGCTEKVGATSCEDCLPGQFSLNGSASCEYCPGGTYSNESGADDCSLCPGGQFSPGEESCGKDCTEVVGATFCEVCPNGKFSTDGNLACSYCPGGTYGSGIGADHCPSCSAGTFPLEQSSSCGKDCTSSGSSCGKGCTEAIAVTSCENCLPGQYSFNGSSSCSYCPEGTYSNKSGAGYCSMCSPGHFSPGGNH